MFEYYSAIIIAQWAMSLYRVIDYYFLSGDNDNQNPDQSATTSDAVNTSDPESSQTKPDYQTALYTPQIQNTKLRFTSENFPRHRYKIRYPSEPLNTPKILNYEDDSTKSPEQNTVPEDPRPEPAQLPKQILIGNRKLKPPLFIAQVRKLFKKLNNMKYYNSFGNENKFSLRRIKKKHSEDNEKLHLIDFAPRRYPIDDLYYQGFNLEDFQMIRDVLGINHSEFTRAFDQFDPKNEEDFENVISGNGKFRLHFLSFNVAFFLYQSAHRYRLHIVKNNTSSLQKFIGLYKVGDNYFAIEYIQCDTSTLFNTKHLMKEKQKRGYPRNKTNELRYYDGDTNQYTVADRSHEPYRIHIDYRKRKEQKKILLNDLKFIEKVCPSFFKLTIGQKDRIQ